MRVPGAEADECDPELLDVVELAAARMSVSRSWAWPMLPECMTTNPPSRPCSRAQALSRGCGVIALVSAQFGITRMRQAVAPFASRRRSIVSPIATTRSARRR